MFLRIIIFGILSLSLAAHAVDFRKRLQAYSKAGGPGMAVMVVKDGKIIFSRGYGYARTDGKKIPITNKTNFNLASDSKQFTAMGILILDS